VITAKLRITGVGRAGNTIITGRVTGHVLAVTILVTEIGGTADPVITVGNIQAVDTPVTRFITEKGWPTGIGTVLTARHGIAGLRTVTVVVIVTGTVTGHVLTIKLWVTGVCRAGNSIVTGRCTGRVLAVTTLVTDIRGTADPVITVGSIQTVDTPVTNFITLEWRRTGIGTVPAAREGVAGLRTVAVVAIVTGTVTGHVLAIKLWVTAVCRAGNSIVTGRVTGRVLAVTILVTGIRGTADAVIAVTIS
jgi:cytoskeletal protein CcmA (bactofilin family)